MSLFDRFNEWIDELFVPEKVRGLLRSTEAAMEAGDLERALQLLDEVERREPGSWHARFYRGNIREAQGRIGEAEAAYREARKVRDNSATRVALAGIAMRSGEPERARHMLEEALDRADRVADRAEILSALARFHEDRGEWSPAADAWARARSADGSDALVVREARARLKSGDEDAAFQLVQDADSLAAAPLLAEMVSLDQQRVRDSVWASQPASVDELLDARSLMSVQLNARAHYTLRTLSGLGADHLTGAVLAARGQLRAASGDTSGALSDLAAALISVDVPELPAVHANLADVLILEGAAESAMDHAAAAYWAEPAPAYAAARVVAAMAAGLESVAIEALNAWRAETRPPLRAGMILAALLLRGNEYDEARAALNTIPAAARGDVWFELMGRIELEAGDPSEAAWLLREVRPDSLAWDSVETLLRDAMERLAPTLPELPGDRLAEPLELSAFLDALGDLVAESDLLKSELSDVVRLRARLDEPLSVAIVGEFNAGKSTLINALLGEPVLATGVLPTTSHINRVRYGPRPAALVTELDGAVRETRFDAAAELVKSKPESVTGLEFCFPHPQLRAVNFWDTPGFNAPDDAHEERASSALERADSVVWVLDARQALSDSEFARLSSLHAPDIRALVVVNKCDRFNDDELEQVREHVVSAIGSRVAGVYLISGREALRARENDLSAGGDFDSFEQALNSKFVERAGVLKALDATRGLRRTLKELVRIGNDKVEALRATRDSLEASGSAPAGNQQLFEVPRLAVAELAEQVRGQRAYVAQWLSAQSTFAAPLPFFASNSRDRAAGPDEISRVLLALERAFDHAWQAVSEVIERADQDAMTLLVQQTSGIGGELGRALRRHVESFAAERTTREQLHRERFVARSLELYSGLLKLPAVSGRALDAVGSTSARWERAAQERIPTDTTRWRQILEGRIHAADEARAALMARVRRDLDVRAMDLDVRIVSPLRNVYAELADPTLASAEGDEQP